MAEIIHQLRLVQGSPQTSTEMALPKYCSDYRNGRRPGREGNRDRADRRRGRARGKNIAKELGLTDTSIPMDIVADKLTHALGKDGTRLCKVDKIGNVPDVLIALLNYYSKFISIDK